MQRQKPVTCLEPVLSVSRAQASISQVRARWPLWHYPSLRLSLSLLLQENLLAMAWPGTFLSHRDWCGLASRPARLFSVYACLGMKIAC